ncbi:cytochrome P450 [Corynebacterium uropygiale]|uniref:Cytochrome P450 n=1 Tax=Corynebacterium uropygiale TaxID=1775911 RepID=A0A9X1QQS1_9CORY|nr:cytochrome P450 [Corynebacterium uropygiale]MCF4007599.1 cytochrome P450 [Corynebacterium uropygiale]
MYDPQSPTLLSGEALKDPYAVYEDMRRQAPVYYDRLAHAWCILTFDGVRQVLKDADGFSSDHLRERAEPVLGARVLAQMTGSEHDEKKVATLRGLAEIAMDGYYLPAVEHTMSRLWEKAEGKTSIDFVSEIANPFAIEVTCRLIGIGQRWQNRVVPWNRSVVEFITLLQKEPHDMSRRLADAGYFRAFILRLLEVRRRQPRRDLLSFLARQGSEYGFSDNEIVALALNIFLAASEPLDKVMSYMVFEMLNMPDVFATVKENPREVSKFLVEVLRLHPPVQIIPRISVGEQTVEGVSIPAGSMVYCLIGAAHRDPRQFKDPGVFVLGREDNLIRSAFSPSAQHVAFGSGLHFCIGSMLARRQLEAAFRVSMDYLDHWQLAADPLEERGLYTRGPSHLRLERTRS